MSNGQLPVGTYILNNGPKKKGQGGRFTMGTHSALKQLMKDVPGITFTEKPEKADFVILPEGVKEPGHKLTRRNPALKDPRNVFSMDQIAHVMRSEAYQRRKHGLMYTAKDAQGRDVQIDVPTNLEPSDQAFMQIISKVSGAQRLDIPAQDYTVARRALRGPPAPVVVPGPPISVPTPPVGAAVSSAPMSGQLAQKISRLDALLGSVQAQPQAPTPVAQPLAPEFIPGVPKVSGVPGAPQVQQVSGAQPMSQLSPPGFIPGVPGIPEVPGVPPIVQASATVRQDTVNAIGFLLATKALQQDAEDLFIVKSEPDDNSRDIVHFLQAADTLRHKLDLLLYSISGDSYAREVQPQRETAYQASERIIQSVKNGVSMIKERLPKIQQWLESDDNLQRAMASDMVTLKSGLIEIIAALLRTIQIASIENQAYRESITKMIRKTKAGTDCRAQNALCADKDSPERIDNILYAMYNAACQMINNPQNVDMAEYKMLCAKLEGISATLCDIYNYLYLTGFKGEVGESMTCGSGQNLCKQMYTVMNDCLAAYKLVTKTSKNVPMILAKLQGQAYDMWTTDTQQPTIYNLFYRFLVRQDPVTGGDVKDRHQTFAEMQSRMNSIKFDPTTSTSAEKSKQIVYAYMAVLAVFFVFGNLCSGTNDGAFWSGTGFGQFTVEEVKQILSRKFTQEEELVEPEDDADLANETDA